MNNRLYVGNLPYTVDEAALTHNFSEYGTVRSAKLVMDRDTGRSKGFGFVEMGSDAEAQAAIDGLHGMQVQGRAVTVNIARPPEARTGGSRFGGECRAY
ncbi:RNA recognition motif domain-containing protein [Hydrogenophaga sp.]|uniref:RNA recognition motif domain-containing protein n=1 Tax=Hydrogenophaga sp. TaxID=1904254 RepID=UPI0035B37E70